ncbi:peptidoglycan-binding protein, partial [Myxococcota bacterium]|nr:peptidoglycan-binding protein [Myxococcota bacterium]
MRIDRAVPSISQGVKTPSWHKSPGLKAATRAHPIHSGHQGAAVFELQKMLNQVGMNPVLAEDSKFGPQTKSAVLAFQRHAKIKVDGLVGSETLGALKVALKPAAPDVSDKIHSVSKKKTKSISPPKMPSAAVGLKAPPVPSYELTRRTRPAGPLGL